MSIEVCYYKENCGFLEAQIMKKIVILGAGIGGIHVALDLERLFKHDRSVGITLVDRNSDHIFTPDLYEVATAEEEFVSQSQLRQSICVPLSEIFKGENVTLIRDEIIGIDKKAKTVQLSLKKISYDYLIIALGAVTNYLTIPGAEKFSLPFKTFKDALKIRNQLEFAIQAHRMDVNKPNLRIVVAGGGYAGVEIVGELSHEIEILAWKNQYPVEKIEIVLVEAANKLISNLSNRMSEEALRHLSSHQVRVMISSQIVRVDQHFVELQNGERLAHDVLIWACGIKANMADGMADLILSKSGAIAVNKYLQSVVDENVYALGDCSVVMDDGGNPAQQTVFSTIDQAKLLARNFPLFLRNLKPRAYVNKRHGTIVSLGGKYYIMDYMGIFFCGWTAYVFRQVTNFRYFVGILGIAKALQYLAFQIKIYSRND